MAENHSENIEGNKTVYCLISQRRTELMGIAILLVVLFHLPEKLNGVCGYVQLLGYGGVDIFLLVSGMGIYTSLSNNSISVYVKHRCLRIVPTWWLYLIVYMIIKTNVIGWEISKKGIIAAASFTGYWTGLPDQGNWYVYLIVILYMVAPLFYFLLRDSVNRKGRAFNLILISFVISLSFVFAGTNWLMPFSRFPIFILGMYLAADKDEIKLKKETYILCTLFIITGIATKIFAYTRFGEGKMYEWGLWWYPNIVIAPSLSILLSVALGKSRGVFLILNKILRIFGRASLEILLVSEFCFIYFSDYCKTWMLTIIALMIAIVGNRVIGVVRKALIHE